MRLQREPTARLWRGSDLATSKRGRPSNLKERPIARLQREADCATLKRGWPCDLKERLTAWLQREADWKKRKVEESWTLKRLSAFQVDTEGRRVLNVENTDWAHLMLQVDTEGLELGQYWPSKLQMVKESWKLKRLSAFQVDRAEKDATGGKRILGC